jgi:AcrR family transcriptional regulator
MARARGAHAPAAKMPVVEDGRTPIIRRPKPQDALDLAQTTFASGARVEMGAVAAQLGISQPTLYRWLGTREQLLDRVLEGLTEEFVAIAIAEAKGDGDERVLDFVRRLMNATVGFQPGVTFVRRESQLALRLVLGEAGAVHRVLARGLRTVISETRSADETAAVAEQIDLVVQICTGLQWTAIAIGETANVDGAVEIVRALLLAGRATD